MEFSSPAVSGDIVRPSISTVVTNFNIRDSRIRLFWLLQFVSLLFFLFCVLAIMHLPTFGSMRWHCQSSKGVFERRGASVQHQHHTTQPRAKAMAIDTWFSLVSIAAVDAFAVVANFNRGLIVTFHRSVSLRMTLFATLVSAAVYAWETGMLRLNRTGIAGFGMALLIAVPTKHGVLNHLWASVAKDAKTGEYYAPVGKPSTGSQFIRDPVFSERLWHWTQDELQPHAGDDE